MSTEKRKQSVTMDDIARQAGVSQSTVSRVFNGNTGGAPEKQAAVLAAMERLDYRPNLAAQGLITGRTFTVGILTRHLGSPFFGAILRGIVDGLQDSPYSPVIDQGSDVLSRDLQTIDHLLARHVDGLILHVSKSVSDDALRELDQEMPMIIIGRQVPGLENQCITIKNTSGAYAATSYLISKGHKIIAHVSGQLSVVDAAERQEGYCKALREHSLEIYPELMVEGDFTESSGAMAVDRLLAHRKKYPFTAIFAANDEMAMGIRLALYHRGLAVPNDVSLIGFDDIPSSQYMIPPLTTIRQPAYYMGCMASQSMIAMLTNERVHLQEIPLELVARQSVAIR